MAQNGTNVDAFDLNSSRFTDNFFAAIPFNDPDRKDM